MEENLTNVIRPREMPHSMETELALVGTLMVDRQEIDLVVNLVSSADFYDPNMGLLFDVIVSLDAERQPIDEVTILERLREKQAPPQICDVSYLNSVMDAAPIGGSPEAYARIVADRSMLRGLIHAAQDIEKKGYAGGENIREIMEDAERQIFAITQKNSTNSYEPIRRTIAEALFRIEAAGRVKGRVTGVATGFQDLDYYTAGFQNSDLILIAARPSMGKTALALNIMQNMILKNEQSVVFFSFEMSRIQLVNRMLAMHSRVDSSHIRTGDLSENDWASIVESADVLGRTRLIIDEGVGLTVGEMRSRCRRYKAENDIKAIFIDYLQLMSGSGKRASDSRQQEISEISRSLKSLARELNVPVIALSQLSRAVEQRPDKRPMLSDLRESGAIEQDADVVMFIYREEYYKKDTERKNIADIIIAKQRNGPVGTIELVWMPQYTKFQSKARE
ncbi:MAG: replicative DNA helicase [Lachnospiraceae bacterium]|nr:replicative DNA helicase [Lachnospiraceae bacterium]